jgi:hypothetical protein
VRLDHLLSKEEKILGVILLGFQGSPEAKREQERTLARGELDPGTLKITQRQNNCQDLVKS